MNLILNQLFHRIILAILLAFKKSTGGWGLALRKVDMMT